MKERTFNGFLAIIGIALFAINVFLLSLSFTSIAPFGTWQFWGWLGLAIIVAALQLVFIVKSKTAWKNRSSFGIKSLYIMGYIIYTLITFNGSLAFIVNTIDTSSERQEAIAQTDTYSTTQISTTIEVLEKKNEALIQQQLELISKNFITSAERLQKLIDANNAEIIRLRESLVTALTEKASSKVEEKVTADTFAKIASHIPLININGLSYQFFIMFLISIGIEFGLFVTTGSLEGFKLFTNEEEKKDVYKYINALFDVDGVRLNSDTKIAETTGIPIKKCEMYKHMLKNIIYKNKPLIITGRGGSKANFSKDDILKIMAYELSIQRGDINE